MIGRKLKEPITMHIIYPGTNTNHLVFCDKLSIRPTLFGKHYNFWGQVVDSETLEMGFEVCISFDKYGGGGLFEDDPLVTSDYKLQEILCLDDFSNVWDKFKKWIKKEN